MLNDQRMRSAIETMIDKIDVIQDLALSSGTIACVFAVAVFLDEKCFLRGNLLKSSVVFAMISFAILLKVLVF